MTHPAGHIERELEFEIELICQRLKNSVDQIEVLNWLNNFESEEVHIALNILKMVEYLNEADIIEGYFVCLNKLVEKMKDENELIVHPIGEFGKSGSAMIYFFRKAMASLGINRKVEYISHYKKLKRRKYNDNSSFILIDDFLGSGLSASSYYKTFVRPQLIKGKYQGDVNLISIYALEPAIILLNEIHPEMNIFRYVERNKAFSDPSPFGYRKKAVEIREFCYGYGKKLFSTTNHQTGEVETHPLGYKNSQALVSFSYGTPNNSLPILWSNKNGWYPILPRSPNVKISVSKRMRRETAYLLSYAHNMEYDDILKFFSGTGENSWKNYNFVTKTDFLLFSILRMKRMKRSIPVMFQILGIREEEYLQIMDEGQHRGLFDSDGNLTEDAKRIYLEVSKMIKKHRYNPYAQEKSETTISTEYVPSSFQGET